ncbi:unnamed protein product [Thlaspi arvense]|uniref:Uncharacterized protein n=1 Tax=Thlaspi arvense TaxID=13288 RepID=A0AAU9T8Z8_THLAR|nr:unnamed protein product [Thlaspi arvense]
MGRMYLPRGVQPRTLERPDMVTILPNGSRLPSPLGSIDSTSSTGSGSPSSSAGTRSSLGGSAADIDTPMASRVTGYVGDASSELVVLARPDAGSAESRSPLLSSGDEFPRSKSSAQSLEDIRYTCGVSDLEFRVPGANERPWTPPPGWICLYEFWFEHCQLWFLLPKILLDYCESREIALTQLCPGVIRNMIGAIIVAESCGVDMSLRFFEEISSVVWNTKGAQRTVAVNHYRDLKSDLARIRKERDDATVFKRRRVLNLVIPEYRDKVGKFERFNKSNEAVHTAVSAYTMASGVFDAFTSLVSDKTLLPEGTMARLEGERDSAKEKALELGVEDIQDNDFVVGSVSDWIALLTSPSPVEASADQYGSMSVGLASTDISSLRSPSMKGP